MFIIFRFCKRGSLVNTTGRKRIYSRLLLLKIRVSLVEGLQVVSHFAIEMKISAVLG